MNGRQEVDLKIENKSARLLKSAPQIIKDYSYDFENKTSRTKYVYLLNILSFAKYFKGRDLTKLNRKDINRYISHIKFSGGDCSRPSSWSTQNCKIAAIKDFYRFLKDNGDININPAETISPPKDNGIHKVVAMTADEVGIMKKNILEESKNNHNYDWYKRDYAIISLGCASGLRCSSIIEINIEDIDINSGIIKVTEKGNKTRDIVVSGAVKDSIEDWIKERIKMNITETDALFVSNRKTRMHPNSVANLVKKYSKGIDKHITPHKMRSTCATNLYEKTGDIYLVQAVLGHKNIDNTRRYADVSTRRLKDAADIMASL